MTYQRCEKSFSIITNISCDTKLQRIRWNSAKSKLILFFNIILISLLFINCNSQTMDILLDDPVMAKNCNPDICPASTSAYAGKTIALDVQGIHPEAKNIYWMVNNSPGGEEWDPPEQNAITENFTPYIIGTYNMQVYYDLDEKNCLCDFDIEVELKYDELRVELAWNGPGDLDLHLNSPAMTEPMIGNWETDQDCFYDNADTLWGAYLDLDNQTGYGPENIVLDFNETGGGGNYHIGVANYFEAEGRTATVKIYCGAGNPPVVYSSRPMEIDDFWVVGTINSNDCSFTSIDNYRLYSGI